ncbi:phage terminase small subunit P27 family [Actinacidiphila epipremni]|uniref:Phage terminase small subunit P27 family n=1 Tax=Actinacidiphila epipremni TaxID=2053013 RepID=A0ABX0ZIL3_9ACTN|nr:phage terminase small subunit P27 family [Actinacidiphila epipremni]NJP42282.1 phage terminase small subunit P27 family [Actinacidiphila epipremni]
MGRTPQPAALKLIKGRAPGKDSAGREVNSGPAFKRLPPEAPEWLSDEARAEWDRVLPGLARLDLLKPEDGAALAAYCEAWATFREATETVQREGLTTDAKQGTLPHPAVGIARAAGRELRAWAGHFGLTPSTEQALARGSENEPDPDNPFG